LATQPGEGVGAEGEEGASGVRPAGGGALLSAGDLRAAAANRPTDELKAELARLLGFTAENLLRLAVVVAELESRGEDLSDLKIGLLPLLRSIAAGTLLPEVVVRFAGQPRALKAVGALPLDEQRRFASGERAPDLPKPFRNAGGGLRPPFAPRAGGGDSDPAPAFDGPAVAAAGNPKDVGELAAEMVLRCPDRGAALRGLADRLAADGVIPAAAAESLRAASFCVKGRAKSLAEQLRERG
jgi:hypothetical protein